MVPHNADSYVHMEIHTCNAARLLWSTGERPKVPYLQQTDSRAEDCSLLFTPGLKKEPFMHGTMPRRAYKATKNGGERI